MLPHHSHSRWYRPLRRVALLLPLCLLLLGARGPAQSSTILPPGFHDRHVADVARPTALAFTPDGRLLITSQSGQLWVYQDGALLDTPALNLQSRLCSNSERGLLGVAVDPDFARTRAIYVYYTARKEGTCPGTQKTVVNRVSRWTLGANNLVDLEEDILIDNIPSPAGNHNGGDLHFGRDGHLYISVGDGGCDYKGDSGCQAGNDAARDQQVLLGKILRITTEGGIPPGNPFQGPDSERCSLTGKTDEGKYCQETFASGLRNPFRFAFRPGTDEFFINDVGEGTWEEINRGQAGADYGWNEREGFCRTGSTTDCGNTPARYTDPIFAYGRDDGCTTITGGAFVPPGVWPVEYDGAYLFGDFGCGKIFRLVRSGENYSREPFVSGLGEGSPTSLLFAPFAGRRTLYYTSYAGGGEVRLIEYEPPFSVRLPLVVR